MADEFSDLLRRAKAGDPAARDEFVRRCQAQIIPGLRRRLGPGLRRRFDTMDLGQSVIGDVLRDLPRFEDRGEAAFWSWLGEKAQNKVNDKLRRWFRPGGEGVREEGMGEDSDPVARGQPGPATQAGEADERAFVRAAIGTLPPLDRRVVELRHDQTLSFQEIADRLALKSEDAARKRYHRAIEVLGKRWKQARGGRGAGSSGEA